MESAKKFIKLFQEKFSEKYTFWTSRRKEDLPIFGGGSKSNGVNLNVVNKWVLMSLVWLFVSLFVVYYGIRWCSHYSFSYSISCNMNSCVYTASDVNGKNITEIDRVDLRRVDTVRLDSNGSVVEVGDGNRRSPGYNKNGYSVQLSYNRPAEPGSRLKVEKTMLFSPKDMGRRNARSCSSKIFTYIDKTKDKVEYSYSKTITLVGILLILFGIFSSVLSCVLGQWSDPEPRRVKKSS